MQPGLHGAERHAEVFGDSVEVLCNSGVVRSLSRAEPKSQDIQLYDVVHLAHHFGVSRLAALYPRGSSVSEAAAQSCTRFMTRTLRI